jgi:hypothetical protein
MIPVIRGGRGTRAIHKDSILELHFCLPKSTHAKNYFKQKSTALLVWQPARVAACSCGAGTPARVPAPEKRQHLQDIESQKLEARS